MAKVYVSGVIAAPLDRVWKIARDFNGHAAWHPFIAESHIEDGQSSAEVGCVRSFTLANGDHVREALLSLNDLDHSFTYCILEAPLPVRAYQATFRLTEVTQGGHTFAEWFAAFEVSPADEDAVTRQVGRTTFAEGLKALERFVTTA